MGDQEERAKTEVMSQSYVDSLDLTQATELSQQEKPRKSMIGSGAKNVMKIRSADAPSSPKKIKNKVSVDLLLNLDNKDLQD